MKTITTTFIAVITSMFFATSAIAGNCGGTPCITSADVIDGSILSKDLAPKTVSGVQIRNGAIFANKIAPGAVTPAKINATGAANGDVLTADGVGNASWQASGGGGSGVSYVRTVMVSPVPGTLASGTALLAALAGITTASAFNPYLLKIEPGVYDLGVQSLTMKPYVDIEGSGEVTTTITSTIDSVSAGTVNGASNAELRFVTVQNTGGGTNATAIYSNGVSPRLTHVTATASGGTFNFGVANSSSSPVMTNVTATASGGQQSYGVLNQTSSSPVMTNVTATASGGITSYGVSNSFSSPMMTNVTVTVSGGQQSYGVSNNTSSPVMTTVTVTASGGALNNFGVSNNASSSPVMTNVTATASGGTNNYGVANSSSTPVMTNVTATASGGTNNIGVDNFSSTPVMTNVTATASGGTNSVGVNNSGSSPVMTNVTVTATGGASLSVGVYNAGTVPATPVVIRHSIIKGTTNSIYNATGYSVRVGASQLDGATGNPSGGSFSCVSAYSATFTALTTACQ